MRTHAIEIDIHRVNAPVARLLVINTDQQTRQANESATDPNVCITSNNHCDPG